MRIGKANMRKIQQRRKYASEIRSANLGGALSVVEKQGEGEYSAAQL